MSGKKLFFIIPVILLCVGCFGCYLAFRSIGAAFSGTSLFVSGTVTPVASLTPWATITPIATYTPGPTTTPWPTVNPLAGEPIVATVPVSVTLQLASIPAVDYTTKTEDEVKQTVLDGLKSSVPDLGTDDGKITVDVQRVGQWIITFHANNQDYYLDAAGVHPNNTMDLLIFGVKLEDRVPQPWEVTAVNNAGVLTLIVKGAEQCPQEVMQAITDQRVKAFILADNLSVEQVVTKAGLVWKAPVTVCSIP